MIRFAPVVCFLAGILWLPAFVAAQDPVLPVGSPVTIHVVQRDETLYQIALAYGLTIDELARMNGIADPNSLEIGQRLLVPSETATDVASTTHVVQAGESVRSIADLYQMTPEQLIALNNVSAENPLFVGQALTVVAPAATPTSVPVEPVQPAAVAASGPGEGIFHTVSMGETLFRIATQYGSTVAEVAAANGIEDPTLIYAGQQLFIPNVRPPQLALDLPAAIQSLTLEPLILIEGQSGRLRMATSQPMTVTARFLDRSFAVASEGGTTHTVLVGVPVFTAGGIYPFDLTLTDASGQQIAYSANVQVVGGAYGSEFINLLDDRTNLLDANVENAEQAMIEQVMGNFNPIRYFDGPMSLPAAASLTSPFGTRRSYNGGGFDRFHSGADFAGAPGTPVLAAAPGVVVLADTLNVRGNATVIDHGWGVYTGYWHQSEIYVQPGEMVTAGQVIGTVGATGRVTGAHLHWELWVNGVPVDPLQWVRQSFS